LISSPKQHLIFGSEPEYHYPQALSLQGGASGSPEEAQAEGGEKVGNKGRDREATVGRIHRRGRTPLGWPI